MEPIDYLSKVEPIVADIFQTLLHAERKSADECRIHIPRLNFYNYKLSQQSEQKDDQIDDKEECYHTKAKESQEALLMMNTATAAAAGMILQIAHQCITLAWPDKQRLNKGRLVGSQHLSSVIWHGRNQTMHFEDKSPHKKTKQCLDILHKEFSFDNSDLELRPRSLAKEVISLLGWHSYKMFADDINLMLKRSQ